LIDRGARGDSPAPAATPAKPSVDEFLGEPTRDLERWEGLWREDLRFPVRSQRRFLGPLIVAFKRLVRPFVTAPQQELWDRQRTFNLILLEHLGRIEARAQDLDDRTRYLEALNREGMQEVMLHNDALFSRVDQKLDAYRAESRALWSQIGAALAVANRQPEPGALREAAAELDYLEFESRFRGTREEVERRLARYLPLLENRADVLDVGCGRGEALEILARAGVRCSGIDSSERMVELCRQKGLTAERADAVDGLSRAAEASLGAVLSFHLIEHLAPATLDRLVRLAWRALRPGGVLVLETPNPLSVVVAARNFWIDPTHRRPVHPVALQALCERAGFDPVERWDLQPFAAEERLPEIPLGEVPAEVRGVADRVNRLRDRLDDLLFGFQDYAIVATKPPGGA
jgi:O-antigen chain-terminating methyltransferase